MKFRCRKDCDFRVPPFYFELEGWEYGVDGGGWCGVVRRMGNFLRN